MSHRYDAPLIAGAHVHGVPGLGVLGSLIPATGEHGPALPYDDLIFPADNDVEIRVLITSVPPGLTLYVWEDGSFEASGADGSYSIGYRLYRNMAWDEVERSAAVVIGAAVLAGRNILFESTVSTGAVSSTPQHTVTGRNVRFDATLARGAATQAHVMTGRAVRFDASISRGAVDLTFPQTVTGRNVRLDSTISTGAAGQTHATAGRALRSDITVQRGSAAQVHQLAGRSIQFQALFPAVRLGFVGNATDLIYQLLTNRQELDPVLGEFVVYDVDGVTIKWRAKAWEDADATLPYRGGELRRIDKLELL